MSEKTELHLRLNQGTPKEQLFTVEVGQERLGKMQELIDQKNLTIEQAFLQTKELAGR